MLTVISEIVCFGQFESCSSERDVVARQPLSSVNSGVYHFQNSFVARQHKTNGQDVPFEIQLQYLSNS